MTAEPAAPSRHRAPSSGTPRPTVADIVVETLKASGVAG